MPDGNGKPVTPTGRQAPSPFRLAHVEQALAAHDPDTGPSEMAKRRAAVAMILREGSSGGLETLFIQRSEFDGDPWSGHMAFPGGGQDPGDATLEAAARRETFEEVGVALADSMRLGRLHDLVGGRLSTLSLTVSAFVFHHPDPPVLTPNHEVADTVWIPLDFLGDSGNVTPYQYPLDPQGREFPAFEYQGYTVWGLTFRILVHFFALFGVELPEEPNFSDSK